MERREGDDTEGHGLVGCLCLNKPRGEKQELVRGSNGRKTSHLQGNGWESGVRTLDTSSTTSSVRRIQSLKTTECLGIILIQFGTFLLHI